MLWKARGNFRIENWFSFIKKQNDFSFAGGEFICHRNFRRIRFCAFTHSFVIKRKYAFEHTLGNWTGCFLRKKTPTRIAGRFSRWFQKQNNKINLMSAAETWYGIVIFQSESNLRVTFQRTRQISQVSNCRLIHFVYVFSAGDRSQLKWVKEGNNFN